MTLTARNIRSAALIGCSFVLALVLTQSGCVHHGTSRVPSSPDLPTRNPDFVDLKPGSVVNVVVPILRSGGYLVPSVRAPQSGNTLDIETGDDFLGYERAKYKVKARNGGGVRISFDHADIWENSKRHSKNSTRLPLFKDAGRYRYVRLIHLIRVSRADHNMAIVAANNTAALDAITESVTARAECATRQDGSCTWVPQGVAVTPDTDNR